MSDTKPTPSPSKNERKRKFRPAFSQPANLFQEAACAPNFTKVENSQEFLTILDNQGEDGDGIVVLMGTSESVDSCSQMRKIVNDVATNFPDVVFVEVDVDKNQDLAKTQKLEMIPIFVIYKGDKAVDRIEGAFPERLKTSLCKVTGQKVSILKDVEDLPSFGEDLVHYIDLKKSECLNCSDDTPFEDFIARKRKLMSDCDQEMILSYGFNQDVMIHAFRVSAPNDTGPKTVMVFTNQLKSMGFDDVKSITCTQKFSLTKEDLTEGKLVEFDRWKFKKVSSIVFYIADNQEESSEESFTILNSLSMYGEPVDKKKGVAGHTTQVITLD